MHKNMHAEPVADKKHGKGGKATGQERALVGQAVPDVPLPSAACAAARRAIGTRNGEQDT
jgi:hypothetical protein